MRNPSARLWREVALASGVAVAAIVGAITAPPGRVPLDLTACLLLAAASLALAARRRAPVAVLALTGACLLVYLVHGYPGVTPIVPVLVALYVSVKAGHRRAAAVAIAVILIGGFAGEIALTDVTPRPPDVFQRWFLLIGWTVAASVAGLLSRQHAAYLEQVRQRAIDAETTREETARRRADAERLRIARELHDSLTHSISIIKVQAGVAIHLARKRGEPVPPTLEAIEAASADAMRELRATLEVLRDPERSESRLERLEQLVDSSRRAGLTIEVSVEGEPSTMPESVDLAAYRIIQESLTNIARHAGPAAAKIHLTYCEQQLIVRVDDDGAGANGREVIAGVGLSGMRERVTGLGGSLHAGPRADGGFRVLATMPLAATA